MLEEELKLWVRFEYRAIEDRSASLKNNRAIYREVEYYKITLPGGNEVREGEVTDHIRQKYKTAYEAWKKVHKTAEKGTDLKHWALMPIHLQYEARAMGIKTIEALVKANLDEKRTPNLCYYQERAIEWLGQNKSIGPLKKEIRKLRKAKERLTGQVKALNNLALCTFLYNYHGDIK